MNKIILCTKNKDKKKEIREILANIPFEIITLEEAKIDIVIKEKGETFFENAFIKAREVYLRTKIPSLAEDSGLVVPSLGGKPGIYSSRFAGSKVSYIENNKKLLSRMEKIIDRRAYFLCSVAAILKGDLNTKEFSLEAMEEDTEIELISGDKLSLPQTYILKIESKVNGVILNEMKGNSGFGYDPLFFYPPMGKTFADLTMKEKNKVSHRGKAFRELKRILMEFEKRHLLNPQSKYRTKD